MDAPPNHAVGTAGRLRGGRGGVVGSAAELRKLMFVRGREGARGSTATR